MSDDPFEVALRDKIAAHIAKAGGTPGLVLTDWIVIAGMAGWDSDGNDLSQVVVIRHATTHVAMGLLHHVGIRLDADTVNAYRGTKGTE